MQAAFINYCLLIILMVLAQRGRRVCSYSSNKQQRLSAGSLPITITTTNCVEQYQLQQITDEYGTR